MRRPGIEARIADDLGFLNGLARRAAARSLEIARLDPTGLLAELEISLALELDFAREADCLRRMRREVGRSVCVPEVHAPPDLDRDAYRDDLGGLFGAALTRPIGELRVDEITRGIFAAASRHRLRLRREYFQLFRSASLVDGLLRQLDPALDPVAATRAHIVRNALSRRWSRSALWLAWQTARLRLGSPRARLALGAGALAAGALALSQCT